MRPNLKRSLWSDESSRALRDESDMIRKSINLKENAVFS